MLMLDAETLAKHFASGTLTKDKFMKLSASLGKIEREAKPKNFTEQCIQLLRSPKELRNYSLKWRLFTVWKYVKYITIALVVLLIFMFARIDSTDLEEMIEDGFDTGEFINLAIDGTPDPLPDDINQALNYLVEEKTWERLQVRQIRSRWEILNESEKKTVQETLEYQEFALMLAIKYAEQRKRLSSGELHVARYLGELEKLIESLS